MNMIRSEIVSKKDIIKNIKPKQVNLEKYMIFLIDMIEKTV